jgi:hypothetical protein
MESISTGAVELIIVSGKMVISSDSSGGGKSGEGGQGEEFKHFS